MLVGSVGVNFIFNQYIFEPSPQEKQAELVKMLREGALSQAQADTQYDNNLPERYNFEELLTVCRPFELKVVDQSGNLLYLAQGTGFLYDRYVITSAFPFLFLTDFQFQSALQSGEIGMEIRILADISQDDPWESERVEIKYLSFQTGIAILERKDPLVFLFPIPTDYPFTQGSLNDLKVANVVVGVGSALTGEEFGLLRIYSGMVSAIRPNEGIIGIEAVVLPNDFGGPVFVFRDGKPELIGFLQFGEQGIGRVLDISQVLSMIRAETGLEIKID